MAISPSKYNRILCPLDLSENSKTAIELASVLAREHKAVLEFFFVSPLWLPEEAVFGSDFTRIEIEEDRAEFMKIRPADHNVQFDHVFVFGNPGPEIVKASKNCDLIVMATHGHGAFLRLLLGSVARYVLRQAKCPVIVVKGALVESKRPPTKVERSDANNFVTRFMRHIDPVQGHDSMEVVLADLDRAGQTAAPVVDGSGECIGILTKSDIQHFHELQRRFDEKDPTVIPEMFEADKYGHIRCDNVNFQQVCRHMSQPVITVTNSASVESANQLFADNPDIHHLVVVDESNRPLGILYSNLAGNVPA